MDYAIDFPVAAEASRADSDILPVFLCEEDDPSRIVAFTGSGFRLTDELFVTCWHCVADPEGAYAVAFPEEGVYRMHPLLDVSRDRNGADLATARIFEPRLPRTMNLQLATAAQPGGTDVFAWGYPLTSETKFPDGRITWVLQGRWLEGYVTRRFRYEHPQDGVWPMYEIDMPAPEGLSGSPIIARPGREVVGVVLGTHEVARIEEFARVDTESGERTPEVQRVVSFALAHDTSTLNRLAGDATGTLPLAEFLNRA